MSKTHNISRSEFSEYDQMIQELEAEKHIRLRKSLYSEDPEELIKAQSYISQTMRNTKKSDPKAFFFPHDWTYNSGKDYKDNHSTVPDHILRRVSYVHVIDLIIQTKINQVLDFLVFQPDDQREGYTIRKKLSKFEDKNKRKRTKEEEKTIEKLADFIENSGDWDKWDIRDGLKGFISKIIRDSFTFNRSTFEKEFNMKGDLIRYFTIDPMTVRLLETIDPFFEARRPDHSFTKKKGYLPRYCQIWNGQIAVNPATDEQILWYPWELGYEIRRDSTDIWRNGYPAGEIEVLSNVITWIMNGLQYNGNFFSQGSNPKGMLNVKNGDGGGQQIMNQLRQLWTTSISGVQNAHKTPVVEGLDLEWIDLHHSNKDMEFQLWNEFLIVLTCGVMTIDPSELGFHFKNQSDMFGQQGQKERLQHSFNKGLKPLLIWLQKIINKHFVSELNDEYEFVFTGLDIEDESEFIDNDKKKIEMGAMSMEDVFEKYTHRKFDPKKDTILNSVYLQKQQAEMYGGQGMNDMVDEETGEPDEGVDNPFEEYEKSVQEDPIMKGMDSWLKDRGFIERK